jgi:hypothetical protein
MKNKFICGMIGFLIGCGPNRDFENKNIFGSQTVGTAIYAKIVALSRCGLTTLIFSSMMSSMRYTTS